MKINAMRAFLISALAIIILYTLGLFLPIIMSSEKQSILNDFSKIKFAILLNKKITFL